MVKVFPGIVFLLLLNRMAFSQDQLPHVSIKNINGLSVRFDQLFSTSGDTVYLVNFWASWCRPCIEEITAIQEILPEWQITIKVKHLVIAVDDSRSISRIKPLISGFGWTCEVFTDVNQDLKRALNITNIPHTLIIKNGRIVHQHNGYIPGTEIKIEEELKRLSAQ